MGELLHKMRRLEHLKLVIVFVALNLLDAIFTTIILRAGGEELNPLMRPLWERSPIIVWGVKIAGILVISFALLVLATYMPRLIKVVFILFIIYMVALCIYSGLCLYLGLVN